MSSLDVVYESLRHRAILPFHSITFAYFVQPKSASRTKSPDLDCGLSLVPSERLAEKRPKRSWKIAFLWLTEMPKTCNGSFQRIFSFISYFSNRDTQCALPSSLAVTIFGSFVCWLLCRVCNVYFSLSSIFLASLVHQLRMKETLSGWAKLLMFDQSRPLVALQSLIVIMIIALICRW